MTRRPEPCPRCSSPLVEINLSGELTLQSCSTCELRAWHRNGDAAPLGQVLQQVGATAGRRRVA
jgi:hypothetical protein